MPHRRKKSPYWWVSIVAPSGERVRRSTGTTDRKEAEALEAKWKLEVYRQRHWDEQPVRTFDEVALLYLKSRSDSRSLEDMRLHVKRLRKHFQDREMNTLKPLDVRQYVSDRKQDGVSNATVNRELEVLSAAINYASREWEWALPNPVPGRYLDEPEGRVRWITKAEAAALLRAAASEPKAPHLPDFISLALHTGMRRSEILGLEWRRVDLQTELIYLEAEHTKAKKRRSVPVNRSARSSLMNRLRFRAAHCPGSPWVFCREDGERIKDVKRSFATACRRAGILDFRVHDLRHTCAAWLVTAGVPLSEVRDLLGHSTIIVTERYAHLSPENVRSAVARLDQSHSGHTDQGRSKVSELSH